MGRTPERCRVYDPWNEAVDITHFLTPGRNHLTVEFPEAGEWDGIVSMIYIRNRHEK